MGTKMGPSYACLFVGYLEWQMVNRYQGPTPEFYYRYIDDGIGISTMPLDDLKNYIDFVKTFHPSISFTSEISTSTVNFLHIKISIRDRFLHSSVYYKPTDSHTYLTYTSSHPHSCKRSIPFSQMLRLRRLCQDYIDFREQCLSMRDFFVSCGYPLEVLDDACNRVSKISRTDALIPRPEQSSQRTKLIMTYHPHNLVARKIVLNNLSIFQTDPDAREVFDEPPLVVYRRAKNIRDMLVRSRISASHDSGTRSCRRLRCQNPFSNLALGVGLGVSVLTGFRTSFGRSRSRTE
ncbi:hypothetical protein ElyMa_004871800 [Elysia marginata]|uniref:Helix-turn-helix domain-containing protein n=1 Tax=Elysia marginata TaxID=1093978 RepID=A0AAV4IU97_9GAST|nr:hypothetical protein ElyMa_004871800 [Elysia marginata]